MPEIMKLVIGWTCVGIFIATALITLLALVGVIKLADKKYLKRLFNLLIVEIVVICVGVFAGAVRPPEAVGEEIKQAGHEAGVSDTLRVLAPKFKAVLPLYEQYLKEDATLSDAERKRRTLQVRELESIQHRPIVRPPITPIRSP